MGMDIITEWKWILIGNRNESHCRMGKGLIAEWEGVLLEKEGSHPD